AVGTRRLPRPVRGVEVQAEKKRLTRFRVRIDDADRAIAEERRRGADPMKRHLVVPKIFVGTAGCVPVVVGATTAEAVEVVVAALERAEVRKKTEVPLYDERRAVALRFEERR